MSDSQKNEVPLDDKGFDFDLIDESENVEISVGEVKTDQAFWKIDRLALLKFLSVVEQFPTNTFIYFSINQIVDGSKAYLKFMASNRDYHIVQRFPILNANYFVTDQVFYVRDKVFTHLVKSYSDFILLYANQSNLIFFNNYIDCKLDNLTLNIKDYDLLIPDAIYKSHDEFILDKRLAMSIRQLLAFSLKASDNKILFSESVVRGFFSTYAFKYSFSTDKFKNPFIMRKLDISALVPLLEYENIHIALMNDRVWFRLDDTGYFSFLKSNLESPMEIKQDDSRSIGKILIDLTLMKKALLVSGFLNSNILKFESVGDSIILNANDTTKFSIGSGSISEPCSLSIDVFKKIIFLIPDYLAQFTIEVYEKGFFIMIGNQTDSFRLEYFVSKINSNQLQKKQGTDVKTNVVANTPQVKQSTDTIQNRVANNSESNFFSGSDTTPSTSLSDKDVETNVSLSDELNEMLGDSGG